jgi:hypothetical protein
MVPMRDALYILAIITGALLYLAPCIIAHVRRHHYRWPITAINLFLGLTGVAWLLCLVWAVWPENPSRPISDAPVKLTKMN